MSTLPSAPPPSPPAPPGVATIDGSIDPLIGVAVAGRYHIIAPLGAGGVARVYRAVQQPLGRHVALKLVRTDVDEDDREQFELRFLREAAQAGRLSHTNVVTVFDFGRADQGFYYLAMELLEGQTLRRLLRSGALGPERAVRIALGIARGLRHAHRRGMVHRDVKPSNVFLVHDDEAREVAKLLDFGLVKDDGATTITRSGAFMGTPHYIAPEQARGRPDVDKRADLYSLGCILYRMLTGVLPYHAANPMAIALQHIRADYPPMSERAPDVPVAPELERIVRRLMEKDPADRYASSSALAKDLLRWLGEGQTDPDSLTQEANHTVEMSTIADRDTPPPKRSRKGLLLGGLAVLLFGAGVGTWGLTRGADPEPEAVNFVSSVDLMQSGQGAPPEEQALAQLDEPEQLPAEATPEPPPEAPTPEPEEGGPNAFGPQGVSKPDPVVKAKPKPVAKAKPKPKPKTESAAAVYVDGVRMDGGQAARALTFLNTADESGLRKAGVYGRGVNIVLKGRPFDSLQDFADTPYIGEKTVQAIADAVK